MCVLQEQGAPPTEGVEHHQPGALPPQRRDPDKRPAARPWRVTRKRWRSPFLGMLAVSAVLLPVNPCHQSHNR